MSKRHILLLHLDDFLLHPSSPQRAHQQYPRSHTFGTQNPMKYVLNLCHSHNVYRVHGTVMAVVHPSTPPVLPPPVTGVSLDPALHLLTISRDRDLVPGSAEKYGDRACGRNTSKRTHVSRELARSRER